jgi:hypothetical protein
MNPDLRLLLLNKKEKNMEPDKEQKMTENGYQFDEDLSCFVNRAKGKIFSTVWIENQNINTIQISLNIPHQPAAWKLFLSPDQPHEEMRNALFAKYGSIP